MLKAADAAMPIGVFDSGLGGLTVYRTLRELLPGEDIIYLGDTARVPYGSKSPETIIRFSSQISSYLLEQSVKCIVVACNTASSLALETLMQRSPRPVLGVIDAGVRTAVRASLSGRMAVIGTEATIQSGAYLKSLRKLQETAVMDAYACPLFVPLVEEGWTEHPAAAMIAEEYLKPLKEGSTDTLILGCTHYPILEPLIQRTLGSGVQIVNPAEAVAEDVRELLSGSGLLNPAKGGGSSRFIVTDLPKKFHTLSMRFLGQGIESVEHLSVEKLESYRLTGE